ncbi:MAG: helix-turn-helix domain-containing protein [Spirochaetaceae bacterium]|jgi:putative molybdopterin biosynthesis protein|nr:helix-turn-helix domain-containing protein [Spirochaetaceae bacterium]
MESTLLTAEDVAKQLNIKKYTVYELIKRKELPSSKVGKQVRVSQTDINRYLESRKTGALPVISAPSEPVPVLIPKAPDFPGGLPHILCGQDIFWNCWSAESRSPEIFISSGRIWEAITDCTPSITAECL